MVPKRKVKQFVCIVFHFYFLMYQQLNTPCSTLRHCPQVSLTRLIFSNASESVQRKRQRHSGGKFGSLNSAESTWSFQILIQQLNLQSHTLQGITENELKRTITDFSGFNSHLSSQFLISPIK